jgi:hypothetical protein
VSSPTPATKARTGDGRSDGQKAAGLVGLLLLVLGVCVAGYFFLFFDVSVPFDYQGGNDFGLPERVNNIGLMADRNNGIIIGLALAVAGGVLMVIGRKRPGFSPAVGINHPG